MNRWKRSEKKSAALIGGKRQPGSGAFYFAKADIVHPKFLIEHKETDKDTLSVKLDWLRKVTMQCVTSSKSPALMICLNSVQAPLPSRWVMFPCDDKMLSGRAIMPPTIGVLATKSFPIEANFLRSIYNNSTYPMFRVFIKNDYAGPIKEWLCVPADDFNKLHNNK